MDPKTNPQNQPASSELNYQQDIHNKDPREIMEEFNDWENSQWDGEEKKTTPAPAKTDEPSKPTIETPAPSQTSVETKTPEPPAPVVPDTKVEAKKEEPKAPVIDEDKIVEKIVERLAPETPAEKKDLRAKVKDLQEKAKTEGRELTYDEALVVVKDEAKAEVKNELKEELKKDILADLNKEVEEETRKQKEQRETAERVKAENQKRMFSEWDRQLGYLQSQNKIPKIVNKDDPNDPGVKTQKVLFEALNAYAKEQQEKGQTVSLNLIEAFMSPHYTRLTEQAGKDAPVNGSHHAVGPSSAPDLSYQRDIAGKDLRDLVEELHNSINQ